MPSSSESKPIIPVLTGPTGAGKTSVVLRLLEVYPDIDVISADSRQIYRHLDIGTDKPSKKILEKFTFHLVDCIEPGERYTAFDFAADSERILDDLSLRGRFALICGGTGLYIKSLVEGIVEISEEDFSIRNRLEEEAIEKGSQYLYDRLVEIDPLEARKIHPHNTKRIVRALEIYHITGKSKSELIASAGRKNGRCNYEIVCLLPPRDELYEGINSRVDLMVKSGLLGEVEHLCRLGLREKVEEIEVIGYSELFKYIDGELTLGAAIDLIKQNSRRFAKRQITWFKGMTNVKYKPSSDAAYEHILALVSALKK